MNKIRLLFRALLIVSLIFCVVIKFLFSIGPGLSDFESALVGGYELCRSSAFNVSIVHSESSHDYARIPQEVLKVGLDDRFIIAIRNPVKYDEEGHPIYDYTGKELDLNMLEYWILDTKVPIVYGPLNKEEFEVKRISLGVPADLAFKKIEDYEPLLIKLAHFPFLIIVGSIIVLLVLSRPKVSSGG